jgi:hypothetical protein
MKDIKQYTPVELDVDKLLENEENPRVIYPKQFRALNESLEQFGNLGVLVFNERSGRIVGGNQRLRILRQHGIHKTLGYNVDMDDDEEMALLVTLNNQGAMGTWDMPKAITAVERLKKDRPDLYDSFNFQSLRQELDAMKPAKAKTGTEDRIPDMEIMPFEHWDYVVVVFKDLRDWLAAMEWFGIKREKVTIAKGNVKVGLGRAVDGVEFLKKVGVIPPDK